MARRSKYSQGDEVLVVTEIAHAISEQALDCCVVVDLRAAVVGQRDAHGELRSDRLILQAHQQLKSLYRSNTAPFQNCPMLKTE